MKVPEVSKCSEVQLLGCEKSGFNETISLFFHRLYHCTVLPKMTGISASQTHQTCDVAGLSFLLSGVYSVSHCGFSLFFLMANDIELCFYASSTLA